MEEKFDGLFMTAVQQSQGIENFFNNPMFLFIMAVTIVVQIALVQFGGEAVKCSPLTTQQHLMCIGIGFLSIIVGFFVKLIPLELFSFLKVNEKPLETQQQRDEVFKSSLRKSRSIYRMSSRNLNLSRGETVDPNSKKGTLFRKSSSRRIM